MLWAALTFGLLSSLHCVGMCGPIALLLPVDRLRFWKRVSQTFLYQLGRLTAYASIGLVFGLVGKLVSIGGLQQRFSIVCGVFMLLMAIVPENKWNAKLGKPVFKWVSSIKQALAQRFKSRRASIFFSIGFLNGLLPCGLVYAALFGALATQSAPMGILFMVVFGLGTVPLMSAVAVAQPIFTPKLRSKINLVLPFFVGCIGLLFVLRGFGLGIPFVSPRNLDLIVGRGVGCH